MISKADGLSDHQPLMRAEDFWQYAAEVLGHVMSNSGRAAARKGLRGLTSKKFPHF
jgi:hypothetical protein